MQKFEIGKLSRSMKQMSQLLFSMTVDTQCRSVNDIPVVCSCFKVPFAELTRQKNI